MHYACKKGYVRVVEHLIKAGADIGARNNEVRPSSRRVLVCVRVCVCACEVVGVE